MSLGTSLAESAEEFRLALSDARSRLLAAIAVSAELWDDAVLAPEAPQIQDWQRALEEDREQIERYLAAPRQQGRHWQLRAALEGRPWRPRDVAAHVLVGERDAIGYPLDQVRRAAREEPGQTRAEYAAEVSGGDAAQDYEQRRVQAVERFVSAAAAASDLAVAWLRQDEAMEALHDEDLRIEAEVHPSYLAHFDIDAEQSVRGALMIAVVHLHDHVGQLEDGARGLGSQE